MSVLTDLLEIISPDVDEEPEDIFACAPGLIFTDDLRNHHGDPGSILVYKSKKFGDIRLRTANPNDERERQLFGQYLWNAGLKIAELISCPGASRTPWNVNSERVLELGAGVGLSGIVAMLAGAQEVVISDYPAPAVLKNIALNAHENIPNRLESQYKIQGHEWGEFNDDFALNNAHSFTKIIAADCYWMPGQHENLAQSMLHFLTMDPVGRILVAAGFHTGRAKLAAFFDTAVDEGLAVEDIYEEDANGVRRPWMKERDGGREDHTERKKWLVMAILSRKM
ncbi:Hypothetical protein R9X50_00155200 [Acrodontium crateriforme]|uniref:Nicotinamide N-methyltransferase n=1 Tax=Acrodontium crateriforme TaxID=150365 RepID=A0AAQ3LZA1_9PEZI|nr:Hypothetical protein R9X50_00155200 [Acrodontium crateriforme]